MILPRYRVDASGIAGGTTRGDAGYIFLGSKTRAHGITRFRTEGPCRNFKTFTIMALEQFSHQMCGRMQMEVC